MDVNPVTNGNAVSALLDPPDTVYMAGPGRLPQTPTGFYRVQVEQFCDECRGTGVIGSNKSPCYTCNGLGYNRVAVDVPVEEDEGGR